MEILIQIIGWAVIAAVVLFVISSVVLFIRDGILAKSEGRNRKIKYKVMFIISMVNPFYFRTEINRIFH